MPTPLATPCPSGPVVTSTPAVWPYSGWPGVREPQVRSASQVGQLQAVAGQEQLAVLGQRRVAVGQDEPVAADPVRIGRVVAHDPLVEQVGQRRQAHRGAGMAVAGLLHGIRGEQPRGVDRLGVELGPPLRGAACDDLRASPTRVHGRSVPSRQRSANWSAYRLRSSISHLRRDGLGLSDRTLPRAAASRIAAVTLIR